MKSSAFVGLFLALIAKKCLAGIIIETNKLDEDFILKAAIKVFRTCYGNEVQTVGIAGPSANVVSSFWSGEMQAAIIVDETSSAITAAGPGTQGVPYKLRTFVVTTSSTTSLKKTLQNVKNTSWWNHMASFLIIDSPTLLDNGCSKAYNILSTAWKMNILYATFICQHKSKGPLIYSFNPYTNQAPLPWQVEKTSRMKNEHPWTLLVRGYQDSQEICEDLHFDKTQNLGGYETRAIIYSTDIDTNNPNLEAVTEKSGISVRYLFRALNSSAKISVYESSYDVADVIRRGLSDINLMEWYQQNDFNTSMTYPHGFSGLQSITQYRGYKSQIRKLLQVLDYSSRYAVFIVFCVTFLFLKFFLQQSVTSAFLNIVLLICNAALPNLSNNLATRIYFSSVFILMVTIQGIYQGQLASLLTKEVALPNVDTMEDLQSLEYTVYTHKTLVRYFETSNYTGRVVSLETFGCDNYVLKDDSAACVDDDWFLVAAASKSHLHLSNGMSMNMYLVYLIREDWPVEKRWNAIISRLFEAHILEYVRLKKLKSFYSKLKYSEEERNRQKFRVMTLQEVAFAFALLGIGLAFSSAVFVAEVLMG